MSHDPLAWLNDELCELAKRGLWRALRARTGPTGVMIALDDRELVNFGSNDYLSLAADERVRDAAVAAIRAAGWGAGASPLVTGYSVAQQALERRLAEFEGAEAALVFPSGFAANSATIAALAGAGDQIFSDEKNHASLIDGCRLSRAAVSVYRHRDCDHLSSLLAASPSARRRLIVTDSVFSMQGDLAPLVELADLAERHAAMLLVDEAHATGVFGEHGRGVCEHLGVEARVHARIGTLSKALGSVGGFVIGRRSLIDWLTNRARALIYSTALPPAACAAALAALDVVRDEPARRVDLLARAAHLGERLRADGWNVAPPSSQIIPIIVGDADQAMRLSAALAERGYWAPGIRPPSVAVGESLLRVSVCHAHTSAMLDGLVAALSSAREEIARKNP